ALSLCLLVERILDNKPAHELALPVRVGRWCQLCQLYSTRFFDRVNGVGYGRVQGSCVLGCLSA
ncbi:MAG: hypothetical protein L7F78_05935, partial [Syntrophales bacterium LBB04]|nr:hypothetical protein [Syntrophales bacterium LBB04]